MCASIIDGEPIARRRAAKIERSRSTISLLSSRRRGHWSSPKRRKFAPEEAVVCWEDVMVRYALLGPAPDNRAFRGGQTDPRIAAQPIEESKPRHKMAACSGSRSARDRLRYPTRIAGLP